MKLALLLLVGAQIAFSAVILAMLWHNQYVEVKAPLRMNEGVDFYVEWPAGFDGTELTRMLIGKDDDIPKSVTFPCGAKMYVKRRHLDRVVRDPVELSKWLTQ